jgi:hypothetical protein
VHALSIVKQQPEEATDSSRTNTQVTTEGIDHDESISGMRYRETTFRTDGSKIRLSTQNVKINSSQGSLIFSAIPALSVIVFVGSFAGCSYWAFAEPDLITGLRPESGLIYKKSYHLGRTLAK